MFAVMAATSCVSIPNKKQTDNMAPVRDSVKIRTEFLNLLPDIFETDNTIEFRFKGRSLSAIGLTKVNVPDKSYQAVTFNPAGLELFEITYDKEIICGYIHEKLNKKGDLCTWVAEDIKNIYFERVPPADSSVIQTKRELIFSTDSGAKSMIYVFKGSPCYLFEKRLKVQDRVVWSIRYDDYFKQNEKIYPKMISLKNYMYGYKLVIKLNGVKE